MADRFTVEEVRAIAIALGEDLSHRDNAFMRLATYWSNNMYRVFKARALHLGVTDDTIYVQWTFFFMPKRRALLRARAHVSAFFIYYVHGIIWWNP